MAPRTGLALGPYQSGLYQLVEQGANGCRRGPDQLDGFGSGEAAPATDFIEQHVSLRGHGAAGERNDQVGEGVAGPVTERLTELLNDLVRGNDSRFPEWRLRVYA